MDVFQNVLMKVGVWAGQNKYLGAVKNAFQDFMPYIIVGAIATLWTNVICNDTTGLGSIWSPIMGLSFLNPAFEAINFCTMGCISLGIVFLVGSEIGQSNKRGGVACGLLSTVALISVCNTTTVVTGANKEVIQTIQGVFSSSLGSEGLFTAIIMAIVASELFHIFCKIDFLKIKMPEQVPAGVSNSFEVLVPAFLVLLVTSLLSLLCKSATGFYMNDLVFNLIQTPLLKVGGSLPGIIIFILVSTSFWAIGLHGDNMIGGVIQPILLALLAENETLVKANHDATNIINFPFFRVFFATGGTGMVLGLTLAIFLVSKRQDNRSIASVAMIPNLFNIGEINMFGLPVVLNPTLIIPFVLTPIISIIAGYGLTVIGFCPIMYINVPWTMPPFLYGLLATGGDFRGGITQLIAIVIATLVYIPFVKMYEKQQNKLEAE